MSRKRRGLGADERRKTDQTTWTPTRWPTKTSATAVTTPLSSWRLLPNTGPRGKTLRRSQRRILKTSTCTRAIIWSSGTTTRNLNPNWNTTRNSNSNPTTGRPISPAATSAPAANPGWPPAPDMAPATMTDHPTNTVPARRRAPARKLSARRRPPRRRPARGNTPAPPPPPPPRARPRTPPPPPPEHGPGHPPPPPPEHGPQHGRGGPGPEPDFGLGPGTGLGFGPGPDFDFDFALGPGARGRGRGPGRRGRRVRPGDVRAAILHLLAERPMHGYEMIQEIAERTRDAWRPSPGSVYPTLQLLDDEGLIVSSESEGSTKLFELTDKGRAAAEKIKTAPWKQFAEGVDSNQVNLRAELA